MPSFRAPAKPLHRTASWTTSVWVSQNVGCALAVTAGVRCVGVVCATWSVLTSKGGGGGYLQKIESMVFAVFLQSIFKSFSFTILGT